MDVGTVIDEVVPFPTTENKFGGNQSSFGSNGNWR